MALEDEFKRSLSRLNRNFVDEQARLESRFLKSVEQGIRGIQSSLIKSIKELDEPLDGSPYGEFEKRAIQQRNIDFLLAQKAGIDRLVKKMIRSGLKIFVEGAVDIELLTTYEFNKWIETLNKNGIDAEFGIFPMAELKAAARGTAKLWGDAMGEVSDVVFNGLIRNIVGGATREELLKEWTVKIPAIEKLDKNGKPWRLSAEARSALILRTETTKLHTEVAVSLAKQAFGDNPYVENFNPMDHRTDQVKCAPATEAGPMLLSQMISIYGLPGRHPNCRCSIGSIPSFLVNKKVA